MLQSFIENPNIVKSLNNKQTKALGNALFKRLHEADTKFLFNKQHIMFVLALIKVFDYQRDLILFDHDTLLYLFNELTQNTMQRQSLALAFGYSFGSQIINEHLNIISVIGDHSLNKGDTFEALTQIVTLINKVIIIYFDEDLSHSQATFLSKNFSRIRTSKPYTHIKGDVRKVLSMNRLGKGVLKGLSGVRNVVKDVLLAPSIFEELNIEYLGPINFMDQKMIVGALRMAKNDNQALAIHLVKQKPKKQELKKQQALDERLLSELSYEQLLHESLTNYLKDNQDALIIAASTFKDAFNFLSKQGHKVWFFDASSPFMFSLADALRKSSYKIILILNSEDIEQASHAMFSQPDLHQRNITLFILNTGIIKTGEHVQFNVYDVALLSRLSHNIIAQPKDKNEALNLIASALNYEGMFALRLSNQVTQQQAHALTDIEVGTWEITYTHPQPQVLVLLYGDMVNALSKRMQANELPVMLVNARFIKPLDYKMLKKMADMHKPMIVYEEDDKIGGFYHQLLEYFAKENMTVSIQRVGINHPFVEKDSVALTKKANNIDTNALMEAIIKTIE